MKLDKTSQMTLLGGLLGGILIGGLGMKALQKKKVQKIPGCPQSAKNAQAVFQEGKVAVILGASTGIGLSMAKTCAKLGMKIVIADIDVEGGKDAVKQLEQLTRSKEDVFFHRTDVSLLADVEDLKRVTLDRYKQVHLLMNNAGISRNGRSLANYLDWQTTLNVNMWGVINGCHTFVNDMIKQDTECVVINTGSKQGITCPPGNTAYNVSKAAVKMQTECLQHLLRETKNCKVSAFLLVPGWTNTSLDLKKNKEEDPNFDETKTFSEKYPAKGAWMPQQVVDFCLEKMKLGLFYIICPDNDTSWSIDRFRIQWTCDDITKRNVPLSRWHEKYADEFKQNVPSFEPSS